MKKVLVLGSGGMLGHMVSLYLKETRKYNIITHSRNHSIKKDVHIDLMSSRQLEHFLFQEKPDIVVNCVGVLIKGSETDPTNAIYMNVYFPHLLSDMIKFHNGKLIHISTDCVFSGNKGHYSEADTPDATSVYGRSKALGELNNEHDLTLRTSIVGPELKENGEGLFHWFMKSKGEVKGYTETYWGGVTTLALAKVIEQ